MEIRKELKDALLEADSYMNESAASTDYWMGAGIFGGVRAAVGDEKFYELLKDGWLIKRPTDAEFVPCSKEAK